MAKVVTASLKERSKRQASVREKRIRDNDGRVRKLMTLDAGSRTFGHDFGYVFGQNVVKARRENKRLTGLPDGVVRKP
jgi:hypothetical protein